MTAGLVALLIISLTLLYLIFLSFTLPLSFIFQLRAGFALDIYFISSRWCH